MESNLFYVEYMDGRWRLFKRNFIGGNEVHPYQLANGPIQENTISLNCPKFLDFLVESLNRNSNVY
jgi:hypothetical protein